MDSIEGGRSHQGRLTNIALRIGPRLLVEVRSAIFKLSRAESRHQRRVAPARSTTATRHRARVRQREGGRRTTPRSAPAHRAFGAYTIRRILPHVPSRRGNVKRTKCHHAGAAPTRRFNGVRRTRLARRSGKVLPVQPRHTMERWGPARTARSRSRMERQRPRAFPLDFPKIRSPSIDGRHSADDKLSP